LLKKEEEIEPQKDEKEPLTKKKKRNWFKKSVIALIAFFIFFELFLYFLATPVLKTYIQKKVQEKTKGLYYIDFDKIRFELTRRQIILDGFMLSPDTAVYNQLVKTDNYQAAIYDISIKTIELQGTGFYQLLYKQKLEVKEVLIIQPNISLKKLPSEKHEKNKSRDFIHQDLYPNINKYLNTLQIDYINIEDGRFRLRLSKDSLSRTSHYGAISMKLYDFYLDAQTYSKKDKLFYSNDIQIKIDNYRIRLSDGVHNFFAEDIYISTKENILKAKSVSIRPAHDLRKFDETLKADYYYFYSPEISFHNFNIANLYFNKNIEIQNIIVDEPKIKLVDVQKKGLKEAKTIQETEKEENKTEKNKDLYKLIKNSLNSVSIKTLDLRHAEFEFFHESHLNKPAYRIKDFNLSLLNFLLDAHSADDKSRILYSKNIRLNLKDFKAKIINKTHNLRAKSLSIHTDTKSLYIKDLNIHPVKNTGILKQKMDIDIKDVKLSGTDFYRLMKRRELIIKKMILGYSNINIRTQKTEHQEKPENFIDKLTNAFLKSLKIYNIQLKNSDFNIVEYQQDSILGSYKGKINFDIRYLNFFSNRSELKKMFSIYGFKISLSDYIQQFADQVHVLKAQNILISNTDSLIEMKQLEIYPKVRSYSLLKNYKQADIIDLNIEKTALTGIDIQKIFLQKDLLIDKIIVEHPVFKAVHFPTIEKEIDTSLVVEIQETEQDTLFKDTVLIPETLNGYLSKYFKNLQIKKLNIKKAGFSFSDADSLDNQSIKASGRFSLNFTDFKYDYYVDTINFGKTETGDFVMNVDDLFTKTSSKNYLLKIKTINISKNDSLFTAKILRWFPNNEVNDSLFGKSIITAYCPEIAFKGIDINRFSNTNIIHLGTMYVFDPSISLIKNKNYTKKLSDTLSAKKNLPFGKIITDSIIISKGSLGILNNKEDVESKLLNTSFNVYLSKMEIDSSFVENPADKLKDIATTLHLQNFKYRDTSKNFTLDFNHFYLNSDKKIILFDNILYYSQEKDSSVLEAMYIPAVKMTDFSYPDFLQKNLIADSLQLIEPYFVFINKQKKKAKKISPLEINLYEKTKKVFKKIDLKTISIDNAALKVKNKGNINKPVDDYLYIYGTISKLLIDSLHQNDKNKLFNTDDISLSMHNYSFSVNKGFYNIDIGEIGFSTGQKRVYAKAVSMNPAHTREELAKKAKTEVKLLYVDVPEISFNNTDFKSLIAENKIIVGRVDLNHPKLHSFKNKHFPLDSTIKSALPLKDLQKIKTYIKIDTVNIHDFYVGIEILGENSTHTGYFDITGIEGIATNITNDKALIDSGIVTKVKAQGMIMNEGFLKASFRIPLGNKDGEYYYGGELSSIRADAFNPLLENLFFVSIRDGVVDSLAFKISANDDYADGSMKFVYHNLKFDLHNKKKTDSLIVNKRGFVSMLANSIIKNDNPKHKNGRIKSVRIYNERDIYRPIFHYWTITLLSGMKTTMGFKSKELKERLKWEKIYEKNKRIFKKKEKKINRKEKRKNEKEISKDLKADLRHEEKGKKKKKEKEKN